MNPLLLGGTYTWAIDCSGTSGNVCRSRTRVFPACRFAANMASQEGKGCIRSVRLDLRPD